MELSLGRWLVLGVVFVWICMLSLMEKTLFRVRTLDG
jgi:hypothetical protein